MDNLVVSLRNREQVAQNTLAFHLEKPKGFIFKPGRALDVTLTNPGEPDPEGNSRMLSIASTPYADEVIVATRVRDTPFKRFLENAQPGSLLKISELSGSFTLIQGFGSVREELGRGQTELVRYGSSTAESRGPKDF